MAKKAQERVYFKTKALVEQYRVANPNAILTRFIKDEADIYRSDWIGYDVSEVQAEAQPESKAEKPAEPEVPEVA